MVELRVTIDEKLNKLLDEIVKSGAFLSKAELMRSATIMFIVQSGLFHRLIEKSEE